MRIASNTVTENLITQIQNLSNQQSKLQTQVSSQKRISQAEDDPAAAGRVLNYQSQQSQISQYQSNTNRALELSQASYAGLTSLKTISDRATELGTLSAGTVSDESRNAYASELDQLIEQALQLGNSKLGNDYLFAGSAIDTAPFSATYSGTQITAVTYIGTTDAAAIPLSETTSISPLTDGTTNASLGDFITNLISLRDALTSSDSAGITTAQTALLSTEDVLVSSLAQQGAVQTRIEASQTQLKSLSDSLTTLISGETDTDLPTAIVKLTQAQTAYQAALSSTATIMKVSLLDYIK